MPKAKKPTDELEEVAQETETTVMERPVMVMERPAPIQIIPRIERQNAQGSAVSGRWPAVLGGQCEYCGVVDRNQPAHLQYTLCPHFRLLGKLRCSYCPETVDPDNVIANQRLIVAAHPNDPTSIVVCCSSMQCKNKHEARFRVGLR